MSLNTANRGSQNNDLLGSRLFDGQAGNVTITEQELRWLSAGPLASFLRSPGTLSSSEHLSHAQRIWTQLLNTMKGSEATDKYMTATCNAISVFLESACISSNQDIVTFGLSPTTWFPCIDSIANVFETGKVKAMRQVLVTLSSLLLSVPRLAETKILKEQMLARALDVIYTAKPRQQLKASMNILELLLRKALSLDDLVTGLETCRTRNNLQWSRRFALHEMPISIVSHWVESQGSLVEDQSVAVEINYFLLTLWHNLIITDLEPSIVSLFDSFARRLNGSKFHGYLFSSSDGNFIPWAALLEHLLERFPDSMKAFSVHLFPRLAKLDSEGYRAFAYQNREDHRSPKSVGSGSLLTRLAAMQAGRQCGLFSVTDLDIQIGTENRISVLNLLSHIDEEVRIRALSFLTDSPATTEPVEDEVLQAILANLPFLFGDADSHTRGEILSVIRRFVLRIRASSSRRRVDGEGSQQSYLNFLTSFIRFLENELGPASSYQRHISALKTLEFLIATGLDTSLQLTNKARLGKDQAVFAFTLSLHSPFMISSLLNLLMDPFQDVRTTTASLLTVYIGHLSFEADKTNRHTTADEAHSTTNGSMGQSVSIPSGLYHVQATIQRAEQLCMRTHRADHADGLGKLYALGFATAHDSKEKDSVLDALLARAEVALSGPEVATDLKAPLPGVALHGVLVGLRFCVESEPSLDFFQAGLHQVPNQNISATAIARMITICEIVWKRVRARLCIDAPESEEDEMNETGADDVGGPKDLLSYSWRALRDSSLLLASIVVKAMSFPAKRTGASFLYLANSEKIGGLSMQQLSDLRHRGAFSTVAQTFAACCVMCTKSPVDGVPQLLDGWHELALRAIDEQSHRLTRRSAGLPALLGAVLAPSSKERFDATLKSFLDTSTNLPASEESVDQESNMPLPQVHILNCLREIMTSSTFRDRTEEWIIPALKASTICLTCSIWAIRNCGLMLFRACTQRLCRPRHLASRNVQHSEVLSSSSYIPLERWPATLNVGIDLLSLEISPDALRAKMGSLSFDESSETMNAQRRTDTLVELPAERVFAGLDLLGRIGHDESSWDQSNSHIKYYLGSRVWLIRDHAARIYAANSDLYDSLVGLQILVQDFGSCGENEKHGRLLTVKYILQDFWILPPSERSQSSIDALARMLSTIKQLLLEKKTSPTVRAKYLDILNDILLNAHSTNVPKDLAILGIHLAEAMLVDSGLSKTSEARLAIRLNQSLCVNECLAANSQLPQHPSMNRGDTQLQSFLTMFTEDSNTALVALKARVALAKNSKESNTYLIRLIEETIRKSTTESVQLLGIETLTQLLESPGNAGYASEISELESLLSSLNMGGSRKIWNMDLRLRSAIFKLAVQHEPNRLPDDCLSQCRLCTLLRACKVALKDDTEFPTRMSALKSLGNLVAAIDPTRKELANHALKSSMMLCDALNDDDEEIRDYASLVESQLSIIPGRAMQQLVPLAAHDRIINSLFETMKSGRSLSAAALERIIPCSMETASLTSQEVSKLISYEILRATTTNDDLFEEEKQNLYTDDIRNVRTWTKALKRSSVRDIPQDIRELAKNCADEGLTQVTDLLKKLEDGGPLSILWKSELVLLMTSIICCAELTLSWEFEAEHASIRSKLGQLQDVAVHISAFSPIVRHLNSVLEESVVHAETGVI